MLDITRFLETGCSSSKSEWYLNIYLYWYPFYGNTLHKKHFTKEVNYDLMHETLQHPGWAIFYIICIIAVVFHFANGLWSFLVTWGGISSLKSQRVFTWVSLIVFLVISYIGVTAIIAFM